MTFPTYKNLDTARLQRLFDNMSECYKIFWFQAIVDTVMEGKLSATYDELINIMIADAWYMVNEYRLNLGPRDNLEALVHHAGKLTGLKPSEKREDIIGTIALCDDPQLTDYKKRLTNNVPYRLQAPFMPEMKGDKWSGGQLKVADRINGYNNTIYTFDSVSGLNSRISISEDWAEYIRANYEIISGWIKYNMIVYLQRRNPSVPGIPNKLEPPQERKLEDVKNFWRAVAEMEPVLDIYGDVEINGSGMSIDHFVPWSYVAHDELWNLSPTTRSINSSKSNKLPKWNLYFEKLFRLEYQAYCLVWKNYDLLGLYNKCLDEHCNSDDVRRRLYRKGIAEEEYRVNIESVILPVYTAAANMGFEEWKLA